MYIFSLLSIWISFLHLGNPLFCECQWQPSPIYRSRGPKVWSCPCSPPAALWLKPSRLDALPVTLIRNGFHKESALVWGCPWWQGQKPLPVPSPGCFWKFPWALGSCIASLFHAYSLSLLFSAFSLILLETCHLFFVVPFVISLAWIRFWGM